MLSDYKVSLYYYKVTPCKGLLQNVISLRWYQGLYVWILTCWFWSANAYWFWTDTYWFWTVNAYRFWTDNTYWFWTGNTYWFWTDNAHWFWTAKRVLILNCETRTDFELPNAYWFWTAKRVLILLLSSAVQDQRGHVNT